MNVKKVADIMSIFEELKISQESLAYVDFHKYRYKYLLDLIRELIPSNTNQPVKILDIGPAFQTYLIRMSFPHIQVDTLGYNHPFNHLRNGETHYHQDLNYADKNWEDTIQNYDIITFCEVIEHLYAKPEIALLKLKQSLKPNGHIIIQTPNAAAIHKRIRLLFGTNPYNLLEENMMGHFREYTVDELQQMVENVSLVYKESSYKNYFNPNSTIIHRLFVQLEYFIPKKFRDGITLIAQRMQESTSGV